MHCLARPARAATFVIPVAGVVDDIMEPDRELDYLRVSNMSLHRLGVSQKRMNVRETVIAAGRMRILRFQEAPRLSGLGVGSCRRSQPPPFLMEPCQFFG